MALSLVNLLIEPLAYLLISMSQGFTSMGCMQRIQSFLRQESKVERRSFRASAGTGRRRHANAEDAAASCECTNIPTSAALAIALRECSFGWSSGHNIQMNATLGHSQDGWLAMVVGPVGCGKSTLLKALIGETSSLEGELSVSTPRIAYCDQSSWITNGTIRDNIIGSSGLCDEEWYASVLHASDLNTDLIQFPKGDKTVVGSQGMKLSGGQKQRIVGTRMPGRVKSALNLR